MNWEAVEAIADIVMALGVFVGTYQLSITKKTGETRFEDDLTKEYREITKMIPVKALLGGELTQEEMIEARRGFYCYVDLSNEQVYLRQKGRIRKETWNEWRQGIKSNFARPAFKETWEYIKAESPGSFAELRQLEKTEFNDDPRSG